jgi:GR25 family glycosyltransferase involved in LPS biosynthesis
MWVYPITDWNLVQSSINNTAKALQLLQNVDVTYSLTLLSLMLDKCKYKDTTSIYKLFDKLFQPSIPEQLFRCLYILKNIISDHIAKSHTYPLIPYENRQVDLSRRANKEITVTMTTCKRFDLFERTINSFLKCVLDWEQHVAEFVVIDDQSSPDDIKKIKELYPFIRLIQKTTSEKGHPRSMNLLIPEVFTRYHLHLEDDWEFFESRSYCSELLSIIKKYNYGQVLININYTEDQKTANSIWGGTYIHDNEHSHVLHRHYTGMDLDLQNKLLQAPNSMYWPHFSFRVGLTDTMIYSVIGPFNESAQHFEMEYAYRYVEKGFKTAFLPGIFCTHIGRRTYERESTKLNAYDLNKEQQFGQSPKEEKKLTTLTESINNKGEKVIDKSTTLPSTKEISNYHLKKQEDTNQKKEVVINKKDNKQNEVKEINKEVNKEVNIFDISKFCETYIINLKRRPDRLVSFFKRNPNLPPLHIFEAVDGKSLKPSITIQKLFETGDYNFRKGIIGCALSHIQLWKKCAADFSTDLFLIIEDDVTTTHNFTEKLLYLIDQHYGKFDLMFLHYNQYPEHYSEKEISQFTIPTSKIWSTEESIKRNMGSGAAYLLTKQGAINLLNHINKYGVYNAIDWVMFKCDTNRIMYSSPVLAMAPCFQNGGCDSDIQTIYDKIDCTSCLLDEIKSWKEILKCKGFTSSNPDKVIDFLKSSGIDTSTYKVDKVKTNSTSNFLVETSIDPTDKRLLHNVVLTKIKSFPSHLAYVTYTIGSVTFIVPHHLCNEEFLERVPLFTNRMVVNN